VNLLKKTNLCKLIFFAIFMQPIAT